MIAYTRTSASIVRKEISHDILRDQPFIYNVSSAPGYYRVVDNGAMFYESSTNTVGWGDSNVIGRSVWGPFNGYIHEIMFFSKVHDQETRTKINSYLSAKWNLQASVDSDSNGIKDALDDGYRPLSSVGVDEDGTVTVIGMVFSDPDFDPAIMADNVPLDGRLTLTVPNGKVTLTELTGITFADGTSNGESTITIDGSFTDLNAAIASFTYTPNPHFNGVELAEVSLIETKNGDLGEMLSDTKTFEIEVIRANDPISIVSPTEQTIDEDIDLVIPGVALVDALDIENGSGLSYADINAAVTLNVLHGVLHLSSTDNVTFKSDTTDGTGTIAIEGSVAAINAALDNITYDNNDDFHTLKVAETLTIDVNDLTNGGTGDATTANHVINITINPINDPLTITENITADVPYTWQQNVDYLIDMIQFEELQDALEETTVTHNELEVQLDITVEHGIITLASANNLNYTNANGGKTVTVTGPLDQINTALAGMIYTPDTNVFGKDMMALSINDLSNGIGGSAMTTSKTITVNILFDAFPGDDSAAVDTDNDGYPDWLFEGYTAMANGNTIDKFPDNAAAALDSDDDGFPDELLTQTFDLTSMNGLALWLDSMNINGNNNYGITDGDGISKWTDLSGSNNHAVQSNADSQPKKDRGRVVFDGINDSLRIPRTSALNSNAFTLFVHSRKNQQCQHGRRFKR